MTSYYVGVDIGGTFTDCVMIAADGTTTSAKTPSSHSTSPVEGVMEGLKLLAAEHDMTVDELLRRTERFSHGTTIGTNLVVERKGARVGLVATRGHGDAFMIMRGGGRVAGVSVDRMFDAHRERMPEPLVPRRSIVEVDERIAADGAVVAPLDEESVRVAIAHLLEEQVEAVAVALLWSIKNPAHELRVRELFEELAPELYVSLSSEISPRQGEFERSVAAVINSYVGPASHRYLHELSDSLMAHGLRTRPFILQASGGVIPVGEARRRPLQTIGSGPAGGLAGTLAVAASKGHAHIIATDMGGTSFEVGLVVNRQPTLASREILDKYTFYSTHLDLRSIACGGGSIARVDPHSGALRVGPESAGSDPGPACYGRGKLPTVTDADLVLGILDAHTFLGGRMELDVDAARRAIEPLATELGMSIEQTAAGIVQINAHAAATLIRQRTIEQGVDPRDFTIYAYGGAGPVHAFAFARELGVDQVVIPLGNGASTLSAYGAAAGDLLRSFEFRCALTSPFDVRELGAAIHDLELQAMQAMESDGVGGEDVLLERSASMRYAEQYMQELTVSMPHGDVDAAFCTDMERRFTSEYARLYSEAALALFQSIEIFHLRVSVRVRSHLTRLNCASRKEVGGGDWQSPVPHHTRTVHWPGDEAVETAVYLDPLQAGERIDGPAVVELAHTTVAVARGQQLSVGDNGTLTLTV